MHHQLSVAIGQCSDKGLKDINQDFYGIYIPKEPQLSSKGIAVAVADGISSSDVSHIASQAAVTGFLEDYYCTSEAWSVKKSVHRVLTATNSWLHAQTRQNRHCYDKDRGYVCTLSAMVVKSTTAHLFHVGDTRIYRLRGRELEQLTDDHRLWISPQKSYLSRAMGIDSHLELDYRSVTVETGDVFVLATDGIYEFVCSQYLIDRIDAGKTDLDATAAAIVAEALDRGSDDNLTIQIVRIDNLPSPASGEVLSALAELPFPPLLEARMQFDGYTIVRALHASSRSHLFLAVDNEIVHQNTVHRSARRPGLSGTLHDGGLDCSANQQRPCAETVRAIAAAQFFVRGNGICRRPDLGPVDDRSSQTRSGDRTRHRRTNRQGPAGVSPFGNAASGFAP
jgi:serine/threonine protein phosphatase PrpC